MTPINKLPPGVRFRVDGYQDQEFISVVEIGGQGRRGFVYMPQGWVQILDNDSSLWESNQWLAVMIND